jgi:poly(A) polymerase
LLLLILIQNFTNLSPGRYIIPATYVTLHFPFWEVIELSFNKMSSNESSPHKSALTPTIYTREHHCVSRAAFDQDAVRIVMRLTNGGHRAYVVGGGVRDLLLGKRPKDFDIATSATPNQVKKLFRNCRIIGRRFKLAHVFFPGNKIIEVATFRDASAPPPEDGDDVSEQPADNREVKWTPDNQFGTEATDALRRDLTINGLFFNVADQSIIDYVGGMHDIRAGIVRIIGDPTTRIKEDPVRMIRVVRHAVKAGFRIDDNTLSAILDLHHLLDECPKMRVYEELKKDLSSGYFLGIARLLASVRLLGHTLPELLRDGGLLLGDGSIFAQAIHEVDEMARDGISVSPTVVLAIAAISSISPSALSCSNGLELANSFENRKQLTDSIRNCFANLAVPKREKEAIATIAAVWYDEVRSASEQSGNRARGGSGHPKMRLRGRRTPAMAQKESELGSDLRLLLRIWPKPSIKA